MLAGNVRRMEVPLGIGLVRLRMNVYVDDYWTV